MKFPAVIAIAIIVVVTSLAMVDATPVLDRRAPQTTTEELEKLRLEVENMKKNS
jgi:sensor domain CHASE-containing protein